ncbi:MAG: YajQ family cyclic di-GMP-binding protein [Coriobacteriia bacterium]|nr:YajQ family cyclic di-GMP-binding protein [Coriobacteriia bacterium]
MAKDNSFDIVSEIDLQEVDNAFQQTTKELVQRYDLKDSGSTIEFDKQGKTFTVVAPSDFIGRQVIDVLNTKLIRRQIDLKAIRWGTPQSASSGNVRILGTIVSGIEQDLARKINKDIRDAKFKVKVQIEGDKLRVSSASRDDLQLVITAVKAKDYDVPLQFTNYR